MKKIIVIIVAFIIICCLASVGCTQRLVTPDGEDYTDYTYRAYQSLTYFGTTTYVVMGGDFSKTKIVERADATWEDIKSQLLAIDQAISENIADSDISKFNKASSGEKIEVTKHTYDLLAECHQYYELTDGHFNPAIGHHVDLWGFTPRFSAVEYVPNMPYDRDDFRTQLPDNKYIQGFGKLTDFSKVQLSQSGEKYFVTKPTVSIEIDGTTYTMSLTVGGVGKGYACDRVREILKKNGFNFGYVSIGSSSMSILQSIEPAQANSLAWNVGIVHPRQDGTYLSIELANTSLSTSGDYERYYELNGERYCHIISKDGCPTRSCIITATAMCESSSKCDALTTAICSMDLDVAKRFMEKSGVDISLVYKSPSDSVLQYYSNHQATLLDREIIRK